MNLFDYETIPQCKIGEWLMSKGMTRDDIAKVELLDHNTVKLENPVGMFLTVRWAEGRATLI